MTRGFADIVNKIENALRAGDLERAHRLFFEAAEVASTEGMMISEDGGPITLKLRDGHPQSHDAAKTVELGITVALLIEDTGHKLGRHDLVASAERYLILVMRYAEGALADVQQRYRVLTENLVLQVKSGAYYGAAVVAGSALQPSRAVSTVAAMMTYNNAGAIQAHLGNPAEASEFYQAALDMAVGNEPPELVTAIRTNLEGLPTGYDPDFMFLPEQASARTDPSDRTAKQITPPPSTQPAGLAEAARNGDFDEVLRLLDGCADVDATDEYGGTALMYAVGAHRADIIKALMARGADPHKQDGTGNSAIDYATVFFCPDSIVRLLTTR